MLKDVPEALEASATRRRMFRITFYIMRGRWEIFSVALGRYVLLKIVKVMICEQVTFNLDVSK